MALPVECSPLGKDVALATKTKQVLVRCDPAGNCAVVAVNSERVYFSQLFYVSLLTGAGIPFLWNERC